MKLAIVTQFPQDASRPHGGVEAVSVNLVRYLARELEVHVVTLDTEVNESQVSTWEGATIHRLPQPAGSMLTMAIGTGRKLVSGYLMTLKPDLVHAHDTYGLMVKSLPLPRVFTVHGFIYGDTLISQSRFARIRGWLWKWVETGGWADQPNIVSISPYVRERVSLYSDANIRDIDNPISERFFETEGSPTLGRIFSAAVISKRKNPHALVEAVAVLKKRGVDVELRLAGPVVEADYGAELEKSIERHALADRVHLLGAISSDEVLDELRQASVFALVSLEENSPMGIEEAMAMGLPVVSSNRCGMPYMIEHGVSGYLVNPFEPVSIADALQRCVASQEGMRAMGAESRRIAERRFHPKVVARKTIDFYQEIR